MNLSEVSDYLFFLPELIVLNQERIRDVLKSFLPKYSVGTILSDEKIPGFIDEKTGYYFSSNNMGGINELVFFDDGINKVIYFGKSLNSKS